MDMEKRSCAFPITRTHVYRPQNPRFKTPRFIPATHWHCENIIIIYYLENYQLCTVKLYFSECLFCSLDIWQLFVTSAVFCSYKWQMGVIHWSFVFAHESCLIYPIYNIGAQITLHYQLTRSIVCKASDRIIRVWLPSRQCVPNYTFALCHQK